MPELSKDEIKAAVREAVSETLFTVGIDISTKDGVKEARANWSFLTELRKGTTTIRSTALVTFIAGITTAIATAVWLGFRALLNNPPTP